MVANISVLPASCIIMLGEMHQLLKLLQSYGGIELHWSVCISWKHEDVLYNWD